MLRGIQFAVVVCLMGVPAVVHAFDGNESSLNLPRTVDQGAYLKKRHLINVARLPDYAKGRPLICD